MSLVDRLNAERAPTKSKFEQWMDTLDEADRSALIAAATDPSLSIAGIVRAVRESGYRVDKDTISEWRKRLGFTGR